MSSQPKQLSSPFSTGGGGTIFENRVQAAFVVLMLTKGVCPCLPSWPIFSVKLQGRYSGFSTDDVIVFARDKGTDREAKLIAQIKHAPSITRGDSQFAEVINSAWTDFKNPEVFNYNYDALGLITGPLSATDTYDVREMLEMARSSQDSTDFFDKVRLANFSSVEKQDKLEVFRHHLTISNEGICPSEDELWHFLKSFFLLGYDLEIKVGASVSLLQTLIGVASECDVEKVWLKIVDEVQARNPRSGVLTLENLPRELRDFFGVKLPPQMLAPQLTQALLKTPPRELTVTAFIGAWDENSVGDREFIQCFTGMDFATWQEKIRDLWLNSPGTFQQRDGRWTAADRKDLWDQEAPRITDAQLERFKSLAVSVLLERDPKLELPPEERYAASLYGKERSYSGNLRRGVAEGLALLGTRRDSLTTCSGAKPEAMVFAAVQEILSGADWERWTGLNDVLPILAEAAPRAFLDAVEFALNSKDGAFSKVFGQERSGIAGDNYMTGLLWGLEALAWAPDYLMAVCRILTQLSAIDPGGNWANRPGNSLTAILLPWLPQTYAPTQKRHDAMRLVVKEEPPVGWTLVLSLLPKLHAVSFPSHKIKWLSLLVPEGWTERVPPSQYWEDVLEYSRMALTLAGNEPAKLSELVGRYFRLPVEARNALRERLLSEEVLRLEDSDRFILWSALMKLTSNHRKFADSDVWKVPEGALEELDAIADRLQPTAPVIRHKRLFGGTDGDLYTRKGDWEEQQKELEIKRKEAIREIYVEGGLPLILDFAKNSYAPSIVGLITGFVEEWSVDQGVLPALLEAGSKSLNEFARGYVWGRYKIGKWQWVDSLGMRDWSVTAKGTFFACLPFCEGSWTRVGTCLGAEEGAYWQKASANLYESESGIEIALDKLIEYGRADAAIQCIHTDSKRFKSPQILRALKSLRENNQIDEYAIGELITLLQDDASVNEGDIRALEWGFLPILGEFHSGQPLSLYRWMAEDPEFFCEIISTVFRSTKDEEVIEVSDSAKKKAESAYRLLFEWCVPPGSLRDGSFDGIALMNWIKSVKEKCIETGHWEVAAIQIGQVLFNAPRDENGLWIDSVCEVLDAKDHDHIRRGFSTAVFNSRGTFTYTAGTAEMELADYWKMRAEEAENKSFSRLGDTVRKLSESYRFDAEREAKSSPYERM